MRPYAVVDYNLTLYGLQSRLQHIYHGQPYARVDLNPMPELTLSSSQGLRIWHILFTSSVLYEIVKVDDNTCHCKALSQKEY
jgi:hypothetical protein